MLFFTFIKRSQSKAIKKRKEKWKICKELTELRLWMLWGLCGVYIINYNKLLPIYSDQQKKGVKHQ